MRSSLLDRYGKSLAVTVTLTTFCLSLFAATGQIASAETNQEEIALSMASLLRSARAVVSDNQALINDPNIGDKGLTSTFVLEEARFNYRMETGANVDSVDPSSLQGQLLHAELQAIAEIVDEWQDVINEQGVAYKGFLPAVFAFQVTQRFKKKKGDVAEIKLTAPSDYVRNKQNMPDKWEESVIQEQFRTPDHPMGRHVAATGNKNGKAAYRLVLPEYYMLSCLACHGQPKGATDKTGGKKEGGTLGALGGAISVTIYGG